MSGPLLRRADARFVLPESASRAVVLGDLKGWREALGAAGVEVLEPHASPELVIAARDHARSALALEPEALVVEGADARRAVRSGGYGCRALLPLPDVAQAELLVELGQAAAARHAISRWRHGDTRLRAARNRLGAELVGRGLRLPGRQLVTVAARTPGPPFMLAAAGEALPAGASWFLACGRWGDSLSRGAFHVLAPGCTTPGWVVKFARVPDYGERFDLDERGLRLAASIGGEVAARAPRFVSRFAAGGLHASVETAAPGEPLSDRLRREGGSPASLALVERVAAWITELGRSTLSRPPALAPERERLARATQGLASAEADGLLAGLDACPAVASHGDLWPDNVLVDGDEFTAVDWENARPTAAPLWDGCYFLTDALAAHDGARSESEREAHFVRLWRGELGSSATLFRWLREAAAACAVPDSAVAPLVTLVWLQIAAEAREHSARIGELVPSRAGGWLPAERQAALWLSETALGLGWDAWR